jgi:hypothetical protein
MAVDVDDDNHSSSGSSTRDPNELEVPSSVPFRQNNIMSPVRASRYPLRNTPDREREAAILEAQQHQATNPRRRYQSSHTTGAAVGSDAAPDASTLRYLAETAAATTAERSNRRSHQIQQRLSSWLY